MTGPCSKAYQRLVRKLTIENLWLHIINYVRRTGRPVKAYEIVKYIRKSLEPRPAVITVYSVIYKMVRDNLLEANRINGETLYSVTEEGLREYRSAINYLEKLLLQLSG